MISVGLQTWIIMVVILDSLWLLLIPIHRTGRSVKLLSFGRLDICVLCRWAVRGCCEYEFKLGQVYLFVMLDHVQQLTMSQLGSATHMRTLSNFVFLLHHSFFKPFNPIKRFNRFLLVLLGEVVVDLAVSRRFDCFGSLWLIVNWGGFYFGASVFLRDEARVATRLLRFPLDLLCKVILIMIGSFALVTFPWISAEWATLTVILELTARSQVLFVEEGSLCLHHIDTCLLPLIIGLKGKVDLHLVSSFNSKHFLQMIWHHIN